MRPTRLRFLTFALLHVPTIVSPFAIEIGADKSNRRLSSKAFWSHSASLAISSVEEAEGDTRNAPKSFRPAQQTRRSPTSRRPKYYWTYVKNLKREIQEFWGELGVVRKSLCIPNEALLNYFGRHDLRAAIATYGGRDELAVKLGKQARIMPGKWSEAVATSGELRMLLKNSTLGLSRELPPSSLHQRKSKTRSKKQSILPNNTSLSPTYNQTKSRRSHRGGRKPKGYWSQKTVIIELYEYLDEYCSQFGRPAVWMPRPEELTRHGRYDLKCAMNRLGGSRRIAQLAGLVPFREWNYFEGQYELLLQLKEYLDKVDASENGYQVFPCVSDIKSRGYDRLHLLIQYYGGRNFLSSRLGMSKKETYARGQSMSWGEFSIDFAIRLCQFIRRDHMQAKPPINNPIICIPSKARLMRAGEEGAWLHQKIMEFGGYENVARRLYLGYRFQ